MLIVIVNINVIVHVCELACCCCSFNPKCCINLQKGAERQLGL